MFLDWKNEYCQNDYIAQGNLQVQCNSYQITNVIFHRPRTKHLKICMETQKTLNSKNNLEKAEQSWRNQAPWLQTILQSYRIQNSTVLAQKQIHRAVEQHDKAWDKLTQAWSIHLWQRRPEYTAKKRHLLNKRCWEN